MRRGQDKFKQWNQKSLSNKLNLSQRPVLGNLQRTFLPDQLLSGSPVPAPSPGGSHVALRPCISGSSDTLVYQAFSPDQYALAFYNVITKQVEIMTWKIDSGKKYKLYAEFHFYCFCSENSRNKILRNEAVKLEFPLNEAKLPLNSVKLTNHWSMY